MTKILEVWKEIKEKLSKTLCRLITQKEFTSVFNKKEKYYRQLRMVNEKHDCLNDKLNYLRTLVRAGDLTQLQELVRKGKI